MSGGRGARNRRKAQRDAIRARLEAIAIPYFRHKNPKFPGDYNEHNKDVLVNLLWIDWRYDRERILKFESLAQGEPARL